MTVSTPNVYRSRARFSASPGIGVNAGNESRESRPEHPGRPLVRNPASGPVRRNGQDGRRLLRQLLHLVRDRANRPLPAMWLFLPRHGERGRCVSNGRGIAMPLSPAVPIRRPTDRPNPDRRLVEADDALLLRDRRRRLARTRCGRYNHSRRHEWKRQAANVSGAASRLDRGPLDDRGRPLLGSSKSGDQVG